MWGGLDWYNRPVLPFVFEGLMVFTVPDSNGMPLVEVWGPAAWAASARARATRASSHVVAQRKAVMGRMATRNPSSSLDRGLLQQDKARLAQIDRRASVVASALRHPKPRTPRLFRKVGRKLSHLVFQST